jgi:hypothetical protein
MSKYNKFMEWFWLGVSILIVIVVTFFGFTEGFDRWVFYYFLAALSMSTFLMRRWMRKRMEKHVEWMEQQKKNEQQQS